MTQEDIICMAREAGLDWHRGWDDEGNRFEHFAALVAAAENEACAKVCDEQDNMFWNSTEDAAEWTPSDCANAIRARGQA
jgi:hypothetical protein